MKKKLKSLRLADLMPIVILAVLIILFGITTRGTLFGISNLKNLFSQSLATIISGLGMLLIASMGGTDISHGSLLALATTFGSIAAEKAGFGAYIPVVILTGAASGLLLGVINAKFRVSSFMGSLSLLIAYRAFVSLLLKTDSYIFPRELSFFSSDWFEVTAVIVLIALFIFLFHYTPFGMYIRAIGENANAVRHAGINVTKVKIAAFVISGIMASLAGIFLAARIGGTNNTLGSGFDMKVMMCMFIGGIPVEGGMGSKIYKLIVGAPTIILLENGLILSGVDGSVTQLIRGIVLLAAIYITMQLNEKFKYGLRKKAVPAE